MVAPKRRRSLRPQVAIAATLLAVWTGAPLRAYAQRDTSAKPRSSLEMLPLPLGVMADPGRMDPMARLDRLESDIRVGGAFNWHFSDEAFGVTGVGWYAHPAIMRPESAWQYVWLGRDFAATGDYSSAAHAYWGAVVATNYTFGSKPDRVRVRRAAYAGLRAAALRRSQFDRAALFELCVALYDTYLASPAARSADSAFAGVVWAMRNMESTAKGSITTSKRAGMAAAGMELLSILSNPNNTANNNASTQRSNRVVEEQNALVEVINSSRERRLAAISKFVEKTQRELSYVMPSGAFASQEVADMIQNLPDSHVQTYVRALSPVAARWPIVARSLQEYGIAPTPEGLGTLETAIAAVEAIAFWSTVPEERR